MQNILITFLIAFILLSSCQGERSSAISKDTSHLESSRPKKEQKKDVDKLQIMLLDTIKNTFVSNIYGLNFYFAPDTSAQLSIKGSKTEYLDKYDEVFTLKEYQNWYAIRIYRKTMDCVYVQKQDIGIVGKDKLSESDLSLVSEYSNFRTGRKQPMNIDSLLKIKIISTSEFNALPTISHSFISKKSGNYKKEDKLVLPIDSNKVVEFKNSSYKEGGCSETFYKYYGEIDKVNSYLIGAMSCDIYEYSLVNKNTGKITHFFEGFPFLSPNSKHLVSIATIGYNYDTRLVICDIDNENIKECTDFHFFSWAINSQNMEIKWINENTFALRVVHPLYLWQEQEKEFAEYIKIAILK